MSAEATATLVIVLWGGGMTIAGFWFARRERRKRRQAEDQARRDAHVHP